MLLHMNGAGFGMVLVQLPLKNVHKLTMFIFNEQINFLNKMVPRTEIDKGGRVPERLLLKRALRAFVQLTGIDAKAETFELRLPYGRHADARIMFEDPLPPYLAEINGELTPARLGPVLAQMHALPRPCLLVAPYVTPPMAERLRGAGVQFLDTAGNAYLEQEQPRFFVFVTGRKSEEPAPAERPIKAFRAAGLKVIFPLLCRPVALQATYREIADMAGVALGTVAQTMADLKRLGLLRKTRAGGHVLRERQKLIDMWVDAYARELRPRLKPRRYRVEDPDWWKKKNAIPPGMWLGGEAGGALLTKYLRPEVVTIYGEEAFRKLAREIRPAKDEYGNLELLETFWGFEPEEVVPGYRIVPPLLVYADLVITADARNLETAKMIKEEYLHDA